ncbi:MAG TPA: molybdopterin-binding oxidoreductase [Candidatus Dormibacteraeota bacterium]|nr:molybdopterin-binding oxidoreductase [Candidatus Dormibacteraeota bacterium]
MPAGSVMVDGSVDHPTLFSVADLASLPGHSLDLSFGTHAGAQHHAEAGPLLFDVLAKVGPRFDQRVKHGELRGFVVITGADGYEAVLSYGEIAPTFGGRTALLSLKEDGKVLAAPRLVISGDVGGGRDVSLVVRIQLGSAPSLRP